MDSRESIISQYENMMYKYGECDIWEDDICPQLSKKTTTEIKKMYLADKEYYEAREKAGGYFG